MKKYRRSRIKDFLIIIVWVVALLPIFPVALILLLHNKAEDFAGWYAGIALEPIRRWRDQWNPQVEVSDDQI